MCTSLSPLSYELGAWCPVICSYADPRSLFILQIEKVAAFCGLRLTKVPRVADIEHEVNEQA